MVGQSGKADDRKSAFLSAVPSDMQPIEMANAQDYWSHSSVKFE
jgi:hypothetical protein